jgi:two-component system NtrC family response regulator
LAEARLIDRQRLAVLLQAAGLLSTLERAGWRIVDWNAARLASYGRLTVAGAEPGRSRPAQELLCELLDRLFAGAEGGRLPGKGRARGVARPLLEAWRQSLVPLAPDDAVAQLLDAAPFLWEPAYAAIRGALAGELHEDDERRVLWIAGPPAFRRLLLAGGPFAGLAAVRNKLAGAEAQALWEGLEEGDPRQLTAARRWRAAVAAWSRRPPQTEADRIALARALAAQGRFETALSALAGLPSVAARIARVSCQVWMGQLGAALATLESLRRSRLSLSPEEALELAEIASRVQANRGGARQVAEWAERLLAAAAAGEPRTALRAQLAAALTAWDREDLPTMARLLDAAHPQILALADPDLIWRWHHARAHLAMSRDGDGAAATEHAARALRVARREMPRHRAAGLWNDLGLSRAQAGDLAGAERAFRHSLRLFAGCDGPRPTTLALTNLAEIRLRRGRLAGVREILDRSAAENRAAGNLRGLSQDAEIQARWELTAGRPAAALALCRSALEDRERKAIDWRRDVLHLLAARALGWLGRPSEAAEELAGLSAAVIYELEPEERPAVQALAERWEEARREAAALAAPDLRTLWEAILAAEPAVPPAALWEPTLRSLEPWRAARLVFDAERITPGVAPLEVLRNAAATLRETGAATLAAPLEARDLGPWRALAAYCAREPGDPAALGALFAAAGCPEAAIACESPDGEPRMLLGADRSTESPETSLPLPGGGRIVLHTRRANPADPTDPTDPILRALLAVVARDLTLPASRPPEPRERPRASAGMVGESPGLLLALSRLDRLAGGDLPLLILGESGTGKELAARRAHRASPRAHAPFLAVNCAALSETLILSDLFGHVKGAFTGADRDRAGVFQAASGGTVFLDEIGDLPLAVQAMLLRVLQEGEVRRLGESEPRRVDVRVLAATHRDLSAMVRDKTFRQDLYFRLKGGIVNLPPLRDRGDDLLLLSETFLSRLGLRPAPRLSKEARSCLLAYPWPGNIRELENVLRAAAALAGSDPIQPEHLDLPAVEKTSAAIYHQAVEAVRRHEIESALAACEGNRAKAARRLGMTRQGLSYLLRQLGIG